jgi:hypothetical protein
MRGCVEMMIGRIRLCYLPKPHSHFLTISLCCFQIGHIIPNDLNHPSRALVDLKPRLSLVTIFTHYDYVKSGSLSSEVSRTGPIDVPL